MKFFFPPHCSSSSNFLYPASIISRRGNQERSRDCLQPHVRVTDANRTRTYAQIDAGPDNLCSTLTQGFLFCRNGLPPARTRWSTFSSHCPLSTSHGCWLTSATGTLWIKPGAAEWGARMLPLCYAAPPRNRYSLLLYVYEIQRYFILEVSLLH